MAIVLILPTIRQSFEATLALTDNCFFSEWPTVLWSGWSTQYSSSSDDNQLLVPLLVNLLVHHHLHGHLSDGQLLFFQNDHLSLVLGGPVLIIPISHLGISSSSSYIWASLFKCQKVWLNVDCSALAHGLILIRFIPPALQPNYPYMEHGSNYPFLVNYSNGPVINWQIQLTVIHGFAEL